MNGTDRLCLLLVNHYEQYQKKGVLCVKEGQKSLADKTGMCLKSINRAVKRLSEQGLIEKQGNKLLPCPVALRGIAEQHRGNTEETIVAKERG